MANIKSAKKRAKQNGGRRLKNLARRSDIKTSIKKLMLSFEENVSVEVAKDLLNQVASKLSRAKSKKVLHRNTASRKLSVLTKRFNKFSAKSV